MYQTEVCFRESKKKKESDILQLFPLLIQEKHWLTSACSCSSVPESVTSLQCWITVVWIATPSILSQWLWGLISTVSGDNNLIMTGSLILRSAALQFHISLLAVISQLWWQHAVGRVFASCYLLCVPRCLCSNLHSSEESLLRITLHLSPVNSHTFLLSDSETKGERYVHSLSSPSWSPFCPQQCFCNLSYPTRQVCAVCFYVCSGAGQMVCLAAGW